MTKILIGLFCLVMFFSMSGFSQTKDKKSSDIKNIQNNCRAFLNGKLLNNPKPIYPNEAKVSGVSGKVEVVVEIDETGNVTDIESTNGNDLLAKAAIESAKQAKFSPTTCDGKATKTTGIITFNFPVFNLKTEFFKPLQIEDFFDVTRENNYYEAVLFLTENYKIAFGYADQKFHPEMTLTKGDLAHFLRQTLEMIDSQAAFAKKYPEDIGLYQAYNPHNLKEIEFNPTVPYTESFKVLIDKYKIVLADKTGNFDGDISLSQAELIKVWQEIFGEEAVPVNFSSLKESEKEMTRGDFAIFLKESLDFLTYKILPK